MFVQYGALEKRPTSVYSKRHASKGAERGTGSNNNPSFSP